jgi:hypothetical protein
MIPNCFRNLSLPAGNWGQEALTTDMFPTQYVRSMMSGPGFETVFPPILIGASTGIIPYFSGKGAGVAKTGMVFPLFVEAFWPLLHDGKYLSLVQKAPSLVKTIRQVSSLMSNGTPLGQSKRMARYPVYPSGITYSQLTWRAIPDRLALQPGQKTSRPRQAAVTRNNLSFITDFLSPTPDKV